MDDASCKLQYPTYSFDDWLYFTKSSRQFIDVSALTATGTATLTLSGTVTGTPHSWPIQIGAHVTPVSFKMQMTSSSGFRPRDSRETAAVSGCDQNPGDCRQTFQIWLAGLSGSCGAFEPEVRGFSPMNRQSKRGLSRRAEPRADTGLVANYQLTLSPGIDPATGQSRQWLPGQSTNFGSDTVSNPDYVFESGQSVSLSVTGASALACTPFAVVSRDYGGLAWLKGKATIQGLTVDVDAVDAYQAVLPAPSCVAASDFLQHPFASLPLDQDCNGMADAWEDVYSTQNGAHLAAGWDMEPGYTSNSPKGDGWSVHDEYRGFHYLADDGVTVHWAATDPVNKFDVFFWDAGFTPPADGLGSNIPANPNLYTQALRGILCLQGSSTEMGYGASFPAIPAFPAVAPVPAATAGLNVGSSYCTAGVNEMDPNKTQNPLRYLYRRVNALQAQVANSSDVTQGVRWFNINSLTSGATNGSHTVIVYDSRPTEPTNPGETILGITYNYIVGILPLFTRIDFNYPAIIEGLAAARVGNVASRLAQ